MSRERRLPELLTVEEAAAVLRVGRTKAYAMAREWRATNGRSGLPVLDFGSVLRVPLHGLEAMVGGELHSPPVELPGPSGPAGEPERPEGETETASVPRARPPRRPASRRHPKPDPCQLSLMPAEHPSVADDDAVSRPPTPDA